MERMKGCSTTDRAPEVINDKRPPIYFFGHQVGSLSSKVWGKVCLGRLEERDHLEVAIHRVGPASPDKPSALRDFLGREGPKRMGARSREFSHTRAGTHRMPTIASRRRETGILRSWHGEGSRVGVPR